ncbi:MAG: hypothetical protein ACTHOU_06355 [Aureliella sp.]
MFFAQQPMPRMATASSWSSAVSAVGVARSIALSLALLGTAPWASAQSPSPAPSPAASPSNSVALTDLGQAIERARTQLSGEQLPNPVEARKRLVAQMQAFEAYLGGTKSPNAQAWFKFLNWDVLLKELVATDPDLRALTDVEMRYRQNILGLEYAPFRAMRYAIHDFINAQRFGREPDATLKALDAQLQKLTELTTPDSQASQLQQARDLGLIAGYLAASQQAPELVEQMRGYFDQPNVRIVANESFVNRAIGRPINQPAPVDECILGTHVLGTSMVTGNLMAQLAPRQNGVSVYLCLGANFSSNNIGYNRGVKVYTTGYSPVQATKLITITPEGTFSEPAVASTSLQTQIHCIEHHSRLVRRIASRKADQQKPEADAIGQYRLQNRLRERFNTEIEQQLAESGGGLSMLKDDRVEMLRLGLPKPVWAIQSTDAQILANFKEADAAQLAAPGPSNLANPGSDVVAEVHQSLPINVAAAVLGGRTIHSWEMDDLVQQFTGTVSAELKEESEGEPWSLTFADHHPVEVEFADGMATVALRISKMTRGDQELNQPATVTAKYVPEIADGTIVFQRQGDVDLDFVRAPSGIRAVTLRSFLKGKFDRFFRERSQPQKVVLGERMPNMPPLVLSSVVLANGWAQVSLR